MMLCLPAPLARLLRYAVVDIFTMRHIDYGIMLYTLHAYCYMLILLLYGALMRADTALAR